MSSKKARLPTCRSWMAGDPNINLIETPGKKILVIMKDGKIYKNLLTDSLGLHEVYWTKVQYTTGAARG